MSNAIDIRYPGEEKPRRVFPMRQHFVKGGILAATMLVLQLTEYRSGLQFNGFSIASPMMLIIPVFCIMLLVVLIRTVQGLYHGVTGRLSWKQFGGVLLPIAAAYLCAAIPMPGFSDGVARTIREKTSAPELVDLARRTIDTPPTWLKSDSPRVFKPADAKWIGSTSPLDRLGIGRTPWIGIEGQTLQLQWGGSLASVWGIAISAIPGAKPVIPQGETSSMAVYPEVWIFTLLD